jgi:hypothetical protein
LIQRGDERICQGVMKRALKNSDRLLRRPPNSFYHHW